MQSSEARPPSLCRNEFFDNTVLKGWASSGFDEISCLHLPLLTSLTPLFLIIWFLQTAPTIKYVTDSNVGTGSMR